MAFNDEYLDNEPQSDSLNDDLDQYGVWVKVGPEEISADEGESIDDDFELHDLTADSNDQADLTELTDEEEALLGELENDIDSLGKDEEITDFEEGFGSDETVSEMAHSSSEDTEESMEDVDMIEDLDIEDLDNLPDLPGADEVSVGNRTETEKDEDTVRREVPGLTDLPKFDDELEELENIVVDEDLLLDSENSEDLEELDIDSMIEEDLSEFLSEDSDLEELEIESVGTDESDSLPLSADADTSQKEETEDIPFIEQAIDDIDLEDLEQNDYGEELQELDQIQAESSIEELEELSSFNDIKALEDELSSEEAVDFSEPDEIPSDEIPLQDMKKSASTEVLSKIEQELLSIKSELSSLKEELSSLRSSKTAKLENVAFSSTDMIEDIQAHLTDEDEASFFEEDEDETIALTGDELDNILNTADITEEHGTEETAPEDEVETEDIQSDMDLGLEELNSEEDLLLDQNDVIDDETEEISLDDDLSEDIIEEISDDEMSEKKEELLPASDADVDIDETDILDIDFDEIDGEETASEISETSENLESAPEDLLDELEIDVPDEAAPEEEEILFDEDEKLDEVGNELSEATDNPAILEDDDLSSLQPESGSLETALDDELASSDLSDFQESISTEIEGKNDSAESIPDGLRSEIKSVLSYMDQLLESLPEDKIQEFANSDHFEVYKRLFDELGLNA